MSVVYAHCSDGIKERNHYKLHGQAAEFTEEEEMNR